MRELPSERRGRHGTRYPFGIDATTVAFIPGVIHIALKIDQSLVGGRDLSPIGAGVSEHSCALKRGENEMDCCGVRYGVCVASFGRELLRVGNASESSPSENMLVY